MKQLNVLIPEDVLTSNLSSDAKLLYGIMSTAKGFDIEVDIYNLPYIPNPEKCLLELKSFMKITIPVKPPKKTPSKLEDWSDPNIGVLVGPNNKPTYRLSGVYLSFFLRVWDAYSIKVGKRNAAWAFYQTIKPHVDGLSKDDKRLFADSVIRAAKKAKRDNEANEHTGRTPQHLQGWISGRRYEDLE